MRQYDGGVFSIRILGGGYKEVGGGRKGGGNREDRKR
jgi:hypothetical protein